MPLFPDIQRNSFSRTPSWRWDRAQHLVKSGLYFKPQRDDSDTGRAVSFLRAEQRCPPDRRSEELSRDFADLYATRRLYEQNGPRGIEIRARILARQPLAEIAQRVGLPLQVVVAYETFFFNVTDRLNCRDWVAIHVIRWWNFDPARGRDPALLLLAYSYWGGVHVMEMLLPLLLQDRDQVVSALTACSAGSHRERSSRLAILCDLLPNDPTTEKMVHKAALSLHKRHRNAASASKTGSQVVRTVAETLASLAAGTLAQARPMPKSTPPLPEKAPFRQIG